MGRSLVLIWFGIRRPSPHLFVSHHRLILLIRALACLVLLQPTTEAAKKPWLASFTNRQYLFLITQLYFSPPDSHYFVCGVAKPALQLLQYLGVLLVGSLYLYLISLQIWRQRRFSIFSKLAVDFSLQFFLRSPVKLGPRKAVEGEPSGGFGVRW